MNELGFCPRLDELVRTRRAVGETGVVFEGLSALSTVNNLLTLRRFMIEHRPARTLEIGLCFGGSCLTIAATLKEYAEPFRQHVAIDPYQRRIDDYGWDNVAVCALRDAGLESFVDVRYEPAAIVMPQLLQAGQSFDLIYIDGSHRFDNVFVDSYFSGRLLSVGGVMLFDDSPTPGVQKAIRYVRRNCQHWLEEISVGRYHPDGASWRYRIAARLHRTQLTGFRRIAEGPGAYNDPLVNF